MSEILLSNGDTVTGKKPAVPKSPPKIIMEMSGSKCPNCGNKRIFMMEVRLLATNEGEEKHIKATYSGCPGCSWLSQMVITDDQQTEVK